MSSTAIAGSRFSIVSNRILLFMILSTPIVSLVLIACMTFGNPF